MFDLSKPYCTRDGRAAKVLGTMPDGRLCGWVATRWGSITWLSQNGECAEDGPALDLVNVPETRTVKVTFAYLSDGTVRALAPVCRKLNDPAARGTVVARVEREITFTIGEGLGDA